MNILVYFCLFVCLFVCLFCLCCCCCFLGGFFESLNFLYCNFSENIYKCYASVDEEDVRMEILDTAGPVSVPFTSMYR